MAQYMLAYRGGQKPASPEEGAENMAKWKLWIEGLGDAVVNPGTPLMNSRSVSESGVEEGGGSNPMAGFSVVTADNIDAAVEIAQGSPHIDLVKGTIVVSEMMQM